MMRIIAGTIAALLLVASPVFAQDFTSNINAAASSNGVNFDTDTDEAIDAAMQSAFEAQIAAAAGVASIDDLTDEQLAAAISGIVGNNPSLTTNQVTALVRAAARNRPGAVVQIAAAAAYARPAISADVQAAAVSVVPDQSTAINSAVVRSAADGTKADVNEDGFVDTVEAENPAQDASPT